MLASRTTLSDETASVKEGTIEELDVAVIGGGQAALAAGYYLRRTGLRYLLLDDQEGPGGAWRHTWPSLRLFSPAQWSSLPGWMMPHDPAVPGDYYPTRDEALAYLAHYEQRYGIPVERPVRVDSVRPDGDSFRLETSVGSIGARAVIGATGTWSNPVVPQLPGQASYGGRILHSAHYAGPKGFEAQRVIVVGGGNSGAQIVAELSLEANVSWAVVTPPNFLPDHVDGRYLFEQETARYRAMQEGRTPEPRQSLGDIVMVPSVREARARGVLNTVPMFNRFTDQGVVWSDGREERIDAVIFATGFRAAIHPLRPLGIVGMDERVPMQRSGVRTRVAGSLRVWLVGYGDWTGFASATLIGVGRSARETVDDVVESLATASRA